MTDFITLDIRAYVRSKGRTVTGSKVGDTIGLWFDGFTRDDEERLQALVDNSSGLTGTGWCGELRDMIAQLGLVAGELGSEVEIPEETQLAIEEEDRLNPLEWVPGMAW